MGSSDTDIRGNREDILRYILDNPGSTMDLISRDLNINRGTLRYHLDVLLKKGSIISRDVARKKEFFHVDRIHKTRARNNIKLGRSETRVLNIIKGNPGCTKKEIRKMSDLSLKSLNKALKLLKENGMIWEEEDGGQRVFVPVTKEMILEEMAIDLIEMFLDGRIDQATFHRLKEKIKDQEI